MNAINSIFTFIFTLVTTLTNFAKAGERVSKVALGAAKSYEAASKVDQQIKAERNKQRLLKELKKSTMSEDKKKDLSDKLLDI